MVAAADMYRLALLIAVSSVGARGLMPEMGEKMNNAEAALRKRVGWLPDTFDTRDANFGCGATILDQARALDMRVASARPSSSDPFLVASCPQAQCGSCWAVSAASMLSDRYCIHSGQFSAGGHAQVMLSPQHLVSCASMSNSAPVLPYESMGCNGGYQADAFRFLSENGTATMVAEHAGCAPYLSTSCSPDPDGDGCVSCALARACLDTGEAPPHVFSVAASGVIEAQHGLPTRAIQTEILANGPVHACFDVYTNFFDFFSAWPTRVYNSTDGAEFAGGHCVKIIGWGTADEGMPFWLIANSWGTEWAQQGVFRYARGLDLGGIDSSVWAACPSDTKCTLTAAVKTDATPSMGRRSGGMWHPVQASHSHVARALQAAKRHVAAWARRSQGDEAARTVHARLMQTLASEPAVQCAYTQIVNGLNVKVVLSSAAAPDHLQELPLVITTHMAPSSDGEHTLLRVQEGTGDVCPANRAVAAAAIQTPSQDVNHP